MRRSLLDLNLSLAAASLAAALVTALGAGAAHAGGKYSPAKRHAGSHAQSGPGKKPSRAGHGSPVHSRSHQGHGSPVHSGPDHFSHHGPKCEEPPPAPPPPPPECPVFVPSSPLLTDSLATVAAPQATYTYAAPGITAPIAMPFYGSDGSWQGTAVSANPGTPTDADNTWSGFGVPVFGCVDASEFAGVRFNLQGDLGSCQLTFGVISRDNNSVLYGGGCTAEACYGPRSAPLAPGANTLLFSELTGGNPNPSVDASQINDIEWQLTAPVGGPPCSANFTITEVAFVSSPASSPELCEEFCALSVAPSQACYIQATVADCLPRCALVADLAPQCEPKMVPMLECMIAANVWTCQDTPSSIFPDPDICVPEVVALQECLVAP